MPFEFKLPPVGENIEQAEIGNLRVAVGDVIAPDQVVMEIETEKAVFDLPCPEGGKILALRVKSGDTVKVGDTLLTLEAAAAGKTNEERHEPPPAETSPAPPPADRKSQTPPAEPPPPASPQSPARQVDRPAPQPPAATATAKRESSGAAQPPTPRESAEPDGVPAPAGPATRRLARELGVDLYRVKGSGSGGRITSEDVQAYVHNVLTSLEVPAPAPAASDTPPLPDFQQFGPIERHPLSKLMRTAAVNLSLAWTQIPHVTQHELADVTELDSARKKYMQSRSGPEGGPKVTMTVLAMKAVVTALKAMPHFNASLDTVANELVIKRYYHVGVAVDTEHGLVVPVLRNVDQKSVVQLAAELTDLASRARARKLLPQDMHGGTFTITNLGGIGGTFFTPIVNYPEVAILGMSRTSWQQVVIDGKPEIRLMLPLSLSYDHRVVNGADAARFIVKLAGLLSAPFQLLSEV